MTQQTETSPATIVTDADIYAAKLHLQGTGPWALDEIGIGPDDSLAIAFARYRIASTAELVGALREAAGMIGGPDDFTGLRDSDTVEHTITVPMGAVKKFRTVLAKAGAA
jgi:hypothetical protein